MKADILCRFPAVDEAAVDRLLAVELAGNDAKIVVLDDDPTGVQTVHDVLVCTHWDEESIRRGFEHPAKAFFILTNSRGMLAEETAAVHREIVRQVSATARELGKPYFFMSRSDSTLRGHYPLETQVLKRGLEEEEGTVIDGEVLCPFFKEGGRFTIGNIHYVRYDDELVPAAETEFARDATFGYTKSSIPEYIEEKTGGAYAAADVVCIPLEMIRALDYDAIEEKLLSVRGFNKVCVNAVDYVDIKVFCVALYRAMRRGRRFLFRSAAGLVKVMAGVSDQPLLMRSDMITKETKNGGVVVVGSHTAKTTAQLEELLKLPSVVGIPFHSELVMEGREAFEAEIGRCIRAETEAILSGKTAVCYTSRKLLALPDDTKESALKRSLQISEGVQALVGRLDIEPAFVVAKGGITSSDIGTKALRVRYARAMGQICPGVPVWQTDEESRFPQIPYIIFPGNVGGPDALRTAVETLTGA